MILRNFNVYFFLGVLAAVTIAGFVVIRPFLEPVFFAILLATIFNVPYEWLLARVKRPAVASSLMLVVVAITIVVPFLGVAALVFNEVSDIISAGLQEDSGLQKSVVFAVDRVATMPIVAQMLDVTDVSVSPEAIATHLKQALGAAWPYVQAMYTSAVNSVISFVVMFFTLFFLFIDGKKWLRYIMHLSPLRDVYERRLIREFSSMARATLKGTLVIGVIQGVMGGISFAIAGIFSPVLWTLVMIMLSIIPAAGSGFVIFPAALVMFVMGNVWQGCFLLFMGLVITSIDNILRPKLVGKDTQMPTILVFFATLGGLSVFGFVGFVIGPIIMALMIALWNIYDQEFRAQLAQYNT